MRAKSRTIGIGVAILALWSWVPLARAAESPLLLLQQWRTAEAEFELQQRTAQGLKGQEMDQAQLLLYQHKGDYQAAGALLDTYEDPSLFAPLDRIVPASILHRSTVAEGSSKHFVVRTQEGLDELLIPMALETLEAAYDRIGEAVGLSPEGLILLELLPDRQSFIDMTPLSQDQVERSGTIAMCRWDHLLAISPRATTYGYPWRDTLAHEYVHLLVSRLSHNKAPVWFHEGLASFLESRWRGGSGGLDPIGEALLASALAHDSLIDLDEIDRVSMPGLPDAQSVSLAFAEVHTGVEFLIRSRGIEVIGQALRAMAQGKEARATIGEVWGASFDDWQRDWRSYLKDRRLRSRVDLVAMGIEFGHRDANLIPGDPILRGNDAAMDFARLGDLLLERGRVDAALVEYGKAEESMDKQSPSLSNRYAQALLSVGRAEEAIEVLESSVEIQPAYAPSWIRLGQARDAVKSGDAMEAWRKARDLNPFDLRIHQALLRGLGEGPERDAAAKAVKLLRSWSPTSPRRKHP